jgi:hypothetical protein
MSKRPGDPGYAAGWCIHYGYERKECRATCAAGVDQKQFLAKFKEERQPGGPSLIDLQPCFLTDQGESKPGAYACDQLRRPTPEEIAVHKQWRQQHLGKHAAVSAAVIAWRIAHSGQSFEERIDCAACGGKLTLHLSIAGRDHVHGKCATPGCVEWME